jgi:hypothetical protein
VAANLIGSSAASATSGPCQNVWTGGYQAGHYRVDVSASGYQAFTDPDVEVLTSEPACPNYTITVHKTYALQRQSAASSSGGG